MANQLTVGSRVKITGGDVSRGAVGTVITIEAKYGIADYTSVKLDSGGYYEGPASALSVISGATQSVSAQDIKNAGRSSTSQELAEMEALRSPFLLTTQREHTTSHWLTQKHAGIPTWGWGAAGAVLLGFLWKRSK